MIIQVCVGSSCYIKGSHELVEMLQKSIAENNLEAEITLAGCFCTGRCNRDGVTIIVDDDTYVGITKENFGESFKKNVLEKI